MTGVEIIGGLLQQHADLIALVPVEFIKAGALPENAPMDALLIRSISRTDRHYLKHGPMVSAVERVSVTIRASNYRRQKVLIGLVRQACAGFTGAMGDATEISVLTNGQGPDLRGADASYQQAQDFRVAFTSPA